MPIGWCIFLSISRKLASLSRGSSENATGLMRNSGTPVMKRRKCWQRNYLIVMHWKCFLYVMCYVLCMCVVCYVCAVCYVRCSVMSRYHGRAGRHGLRTPRMHESKCSGHAMTMLPPPRPAQHQPPEIIHFPTLTTVSQSLESTLPHRHNSPASTIVDRVWQFWHRSDVAQYLAKKANAFTQALRIFANQSTCWSITSNF